LFFILVATFLIITLPIFSVFFTHAQVNPAYLFTFSSLLVFESAICHTTSR